MTTPRTIPLPSLLNTDTSQTGIVGLYTYEDQVPAIAVFAAEVTGGEPVPLDETLDVRGFPREALPWAEMAFPSTEHALKDYLRGS